MVETLVTSFRLGAKGLFSGAKCIVVSGSVDFQKKIQELSNPEVWGGSGGLFGG